MSPGVLENNVIQSEGYRYLLPIGECLQFSIGNVFECFQTYSLQFTLGLPHR